VGEEVYTINIQPTSNYLDIAACEPSAANLLPRLLYTLSPFLPTRLNYLPKSSLRHIRTFSMYSREKRLRSCLLIASLTMKFTSRMTRHPLIATSTHSLAQSLGSCANSSTTCLARGSSDRRNHQAVPSPLCEEEGWHLPLCVDFRNLNKITRKDRYPIPLVTNLLDNWAARRSTPS